MIDRGVVSEGERRPEEETQQGGAERVPTSNEGTRRKEEEERERTAMSRSCASVAEEVRRWEGRNVREEKLEDVRDRFNGCDYQQGMATGGPVGTNDPTAIIIWPP
ncbi:hypothetical protein DPEC_G00288000 [Dallia pectoralis]|uniref:Uncharacterized protein n=1 Tax=Dallia pectoralis TaxID=75939 RepID=A0ACC2FKE7_DALPE|nr:hypothetical protein DPEC_G00288000 [Dallia pectoralis]